MPGARAFLLNKDDRTGSEAFTVDAYEPPLLSVRSSYTFDPGEVIHIRIERDGQSVIKRAEIARIVRERPPYLLELELSDPEPS